MAEADQDMAETDHHARGRVCNSSILPPLCARFVSEESTLPTLVGRGIGAWTGCIVQIGGRGEVANNKQTDRLMFPTC